MSNTLRMDAEDEGGVDFRCVLLDVDGDLHKEDIDSLKFLCRDFAPLSRLEHIKNGTELFSLLEKRGKLKETKKWVLAEMLKRIMRLDLVETLQVDDKELDRYLSMYGSHFSPYRNLLLDLSDEIGEEDLHKLLFCSADIPRAKQQKIHSVLDFFLILEQMKKISPENVDILEGSLKQIGRLDLVENIKNFKQKMNVNTSTVEQSAVITVGRTNTPEEKVHHPKRKIHVDYPTEQTKPGRTTASVVPENPQPTQSPPSEPAIPDTVIHDIALHISNTQFFALGTQLNIPDLTLQNLSRYYHSPHDRNTNMIKLWLQMINSTHDRKKIIRDLSNAMRNCEMTQIAAMLENILEDHDINTREQRTHEADIIDPEISIREPGADEATTTDPEISIREQRTHEANRIANQIPNVEEQLETTDVDQCLVLYYKMDANPRGICVIINNRDFEKDRVKPEAKDLPNREGTDVDAVKLKETFENLQFIIQYEENLPDSDMVQTVNQLALSDHSDYDCFVCCILSHGTEGAIYGSNGCLVKIRDLTAPFRTQSCPTLSGKPKLFFIQACQGEEEQKGHDTQTDGDIDMDVQQEETIPNEADFLLGYATVPGFMSYRSTSAGSWYIRKLTEILNKCAKKEDVFSLLTLVNYEVGKEDIEFEDELCKQSPSYFSSSRKKLIFK